MLRWCQRGKRICGGAVRKLSVLGLGLIVAGFGAWFLDTGGANAQVTGVVVPGVPVIFGIVDEYIENRRKTKRERVEELLHDDTYKNPVVVVVYLILALQLLQRAMGMLVGAAMGTALDAAGRADLTTSIVVANSGLLTFLYSLPLIVLLAKYTAHHIRNRAALWISGGFIVSQLMSEALPFLLFGSAYSAEPLVLMVGVAIACLLLVGSAALGSWWARRTHQAYIMSRLFKRLSPSDRRDLIDLVQTLPGIPN